MDLEEFKKKKLEEIQERQQKQLELQQQIQVLEQAVKNYLASEAITRYNTLKTAHPEKAVQVLTILAQIIQSNQVKQKITDEQLKNILQQIQPPKKEFKFIRK